MAASRNGTSNKRVRAKFDEVSLCSDLGGNSIPIAVVADAEPAIQ